MRAVVLSTLGTKASETMILTMLNRNDSASSYKGLTRFSQKQYKWTINIDTDIIHTKRQDNMISKN